MDPDLIAETLEAMATDEVARRAGRHLRPLRGIRGVPRAEVARIAAAAWAEDRPTLPGDAESLGELYGMAWEDGLVAVGLLAALVPEAPEEALELGLDWVERVDDIETADALGWLVLGPAALAAGVPPDRVAAPLSSHSHSAARRAGAMMGMALVPVRVEGPAAAPLRERMGVRHLRFVDEPRSANLGAVLDLFWRDPSPPVRKALRRVIRAWADVDPAAVVGWAEAARGGLPKLLRDEVVRARRRAPR